METSEAKTLIKRIEKLERTLGDILQELKKDRKTVNVINVHIPGEQLEQQINDRIDEILGKSNTQ